MGLGDPRAIFGVHSVTPYSRSDGTPYGILRVVNNASLAFSGKLVELMGGSSKYPFAVEEGPISTQLSLKFDEYPDFVFTLFMGATPVDNTADSLGAVSALTNKQGTSVLNAVTGIASVAVLTGSEGDLKFTKYVVKAISATTVNVYGMTNVDFARGTAQVFQDNTLVLLAAAVTITTGGVFTNITGFGFKFAGGSGAIALVTGDTATFEARPKNTGSIIYTIGAAASVFPEFGCLVYAKKRGTGEMFEFDCPRVKAEGVPVSLSPNKWSEADVKATLMYDSTLDYVARFRNVTPITPN